MLKKLLFLLIIFSIFGKYSISQERELNTENFSTIDLKNKVLNTESLIKPEITSEISKSNKSPAVALLLSLVLPGSGHYYLDRMDVGKYFLGVDGVGWLGLISMNVYGDAVQDDARSYSAIHADIYNPGNKDDDFYTNIGNYNSVYDYNNQKLTLGEYNLLYSPQQNYWNWDNTANRNFYESQRKKSERIYNNRIVFSSLLIANRIVSGISAFLIAKNTDKKSLGVSVIPELMYKNDLTIDGIKLNLNKNF